jgi:hypothetical protein
MRKKEIIVRVGKKQNSYNVLVGNLKEKDRFEDLVVDGKKVLELILNK